MDEVEDLVEDYKRTLFARLVEVVQDRRHAANWWISAPAAEALIDEIREEMFGKNAK